MSVYWHFPVICPYNSNSSLGTITVGLSKIIVLTKVNKSNFVAYVLKEIKKYLVETVISQKIKSKVLRANFKSVTNFTPSS
jgi:hypothetical protein